MLWALRGVVIDRLSIARLVAGLGASWHTVNDAVLAADRQLLIEDPTRLDGVRVIGVDEHVWRHTRRGDKYVTVIIDLTPVRDGTEPWRLLDMVEGRWKQLFKDWLEARTTQFRNGIQVVGPPQSPDLRNGLLAASTLGRVGSETAVAEVSQARRTVAHALHSQPLERPSDAGTPVRPRWLAPICTPDLRCCDVRGNPPIENQATSTRWRRLGQRRRRCQTPEPETASA